MNKKIFLILLFALLTAGCANNNLYEWGEYEQTLFIVYHEPAHKGEALARYQEFVKKDFQRRPLAPGLYAEAGTFLLEQGDVEGAIAYYKLEHENWPESQPMLENLIENLEAQQSTTSP